ncbi:virion structural protein [Pseudomonas phage PPpW-4]|uniref:Uncharacterized protein n=1 Tax=Pseudomonas phage PPpW-4 TaxID=1279083 RepID=V5YTS0_9CAUD|nr:virion structural protein [Pseudomonas phage PPpW-4]BAO20669.1 hypothetical protein [Pseudomonas phage PPpW-4]
MTTKAKRKPQTIKLNGRKYVVVHTSIARKDHKNVVLQLVKRAGKVQWFVKEGDVLTRKADFWAALELYSVRQEALGLVPKDALPAEELAEIIGVESEVYGRGEINDAQA